jgi:two-component system OmpR family response regulator
VVEDDVKLARTLRRGLQQEGYMVDVAHTGDVALAQTLEHDYDAIVLDVLLPGTNGFEICSQLRERDPWVPVLMLTALDEVADRIRGLDSGADDYLVKPFDFGELLARVRALTRRGPTERPLPLEVGNIRADPLTRRVIWGEREAELSPREFELLAFLLKRSGEVVSRAQLLEQIWGEDHEGSPNVVDVYLGYLRRKLEPPRLIRTVRGAGFVVEPE